MALRGFARRRSGPRRRLRRLPRRRRTAPPRRPTGASRRAGRDERPARVTLPGKDRARRHPTAALRRRRARVGPHHRPAWGRRRRDRGCARDHRHRAAARFLAVLGRRTQVSDPRHPPAGPARPRLDHAAPRRRRHPDDREHLLPTRSHPFGSLRPPGDPLHRGHPGRRGARGGRRRAAARRHGTARPRIAAPEHRRARRGRRRRCGLQRTRAARQVALGVGRVPPQGPTAQTRRSRARAPPAHVGQRLRLSGAAPLRRDDEHGGHGPPVQDRAPAHRSCSPRRAARRLAAESSGLGQRRRRRHAAPALVRRLARDQPGRGDRQRDLRGTARRGSRPSPQRGGRVTRDRSSQLHRHLARYAHRRARGRPARRDSGLPSPTGRRPE